MGAGRICPSGLTSLFLVSSYSLEALVASTVFLHKSQSVSCSARDPSLPSGAHGGLGTPEVLDFGLKLEPLSGVSVRVCVSGEYQLPGQGKMIC